MANKTPAKRRKTISVAEKFENLQTRLLEEEEDPSTRVLLDKTQSLVALVLGAVTEDQEALSVLLEKINMLLLQVGAWPSASRIKPPASLWLAVASLHDDFKRVEEERLKSSHMEVSASDLQMSEDALATDIVNLCGDTLQGFNEVEENIDALKGSEFSAHGGYSNIGTISCSLIELEREVKLQSSDMAKQIKEIRD